MPRVERACERRMPRGVYDALHAYADTWATRGVRAWEERWWMHQHQGELRDFAAVA